MNIRAGSRVLSAVGTPPPHGVRTWTVTHLRLRLFVSGRLVVGPLPISLRPALTSKGLRRGGPKRSRLSSMSVPEAEALANSFALHELFGKRIQFQRGEQNDDKGKSVGVSL